MKTTTVKMKLITLVHILFSFITSANGCQQPCLFVSNTTHILSVPASLDHNPVSVLSKLSRAIALDVHVRHKMIFWSDVSDKSIKRANTDGSNMQVIVEDGIGVCSGLAVEWSTDLLYWTDTTFNKIEVAHLDGSRRRVLVSANLDEPRGIAVDPVSGVMFWTDWGLNPKIESAYLNGENRQAIITSSLGYPNDIALDHTPKKIYWADAKTDKIESADYSGTNRKQLFYNAIIHPFGVALLSQWLYWTDWNTGSGLHQMNKTTGDLTNKIHISSPRSRMGLAVFDSSVQPSTSNYCQQNNGGCSFLCLLEPNGYVCTCPFGMVLGNDNKTCIIPANGCQQPCLYVSNTTHIISVPASLDHNPVVVLSNLSRAVAIDVHVRHKMIFWSDVSDKSIKRANTDGSNMQVIVEDGIGVCVGLAVEWSTDLLYWTDTTFNKIEVAHLDGSRRRVLISDNLHEPRGIAVDPMSGNVFWTDWGLNPKIESAYLNGENRQAIITSSLGYPNDIALDHTPKKIYWTDAKTDKIESADYSGTNRKQLFYNAIIHPFGVALLSQWLYWTDWNTGSGLHQMNKTTGDLTNKIHILSPRSRMGLAVFDSSVQPSTSNDCQQNNGGCSFLCLFKPNGYTSCVCPNGTTLGKDGNTCNAADSQPPIFTSCPRHIVKYADRDRTARFTWVSPNATDNSNISIVGVANPPVQLGEGVYHVSYTATDQANNKATCSFSITVKVINCTILHPSGVLQKTGCDNHYGGTCSFICPIGYRLVGMATLTCLSTNEGPPGVWDTTMPRCKAIVCSALTAPANAIKSRCHGQTHESLGTVCKFSCVHGYQPVIAQLKRCQANGTWSGITLVCHPGCPPGYYLASSNKSCSPCPVKHYQENEGKTSCAACPSGTSTRDNTGSKSCLKERKTGSQNTSKSVVVPVVIPLFVVIIICVVGVVLFKHYRRRTLARADTAKQKVVTMRTDNPIYDPTTPDDHTPATITDSGECAFQNKGYGSDVSKA